jgi:hypothetical protein
MPSGLMGKSFRLSMVTTTVQLCKSKIVTKALIDSSASLRAYFVAQLRREGHLNHLQRVFLSLQAALKASQEAYGACASRDAIERLRTELQKERFAEQGMAAFVASDMGIDSGPLKYEASSARGEPVGAKLLTEGESFSETKQRNKLARAGQKLAETRSRIGPLEEELEQLCGRTPEWQVLLNSCLEFATSSEQLFLWALVLCYYS